ncbi:hypothetical protein [Rhodococcus sp. WS3]|uniref:hypothetical protein n=1 Tax=Rhodococcus sp. WS3 TaxID=2486271 RepID=UPI001C9E11D4|nr:hypothetical protein [Rhodococcus sp. WS3]
MQTRLPLGNGPVSDWAADFRVGLVSSKTGIPGGHGDCVRLEVGAETVANWHAGT